MQTIFKSEEGEKAILGLYDKALAAWPVPNETLFIDTRVGKTFIVACGAKTALPLVLLHGSGANTLAWLHDMTELSKQFRVYAVDTPGDPGRSAQNNPGWEGALYAAWLNDVFAGLAITNAVIAGVSMGGWIAVKYTGLYPGKVKHLILFSAGGIYPARVSCFIKMQFYMPFGKWGKDQVRRLVFGTRKLSPETILYFDLISKHYKYRQGTMPLLTDSELKSLTMPVLYVAGTKDTMLNSRKSAQRLQMFLPHLTVKLIKGGSHGLINLAGYILSFTDRT